TDVVTIINFINAHPGGSNIGKIHPSGTAPKGYIDVVANNTIAAEDVIAVINYINAQPRFKSVSAADTSSATGTSSDTSLNPAAVDAYLLSATLDSNVSGKKK